MMITDRRELIRPRSTKKRNSGTTSTTGGTTISATVRLKNTRRPGKLARASGYAASAAIAVETTTEAMVIITEFPIQVSNSPSRNARRKFSSVGSDGGRKRLSRYSARVLNAVTMMK